MNSNHSLDVITTVATKRRATGRWALVEHLRRQGENTALFVSLAQAAGIDIGDSACAPMVPCLVGSSIDAQRLSDALTRRGITADPIVFPEVPEGEARLRFFVTSCHSPEQIRSMVTALAEELERLHAPAAFEFATSASHE